jgi:predicted dehydrogenase
MVGFNRRFAPQTVKMRELLCGMAENKAVVITVNPGAIPANHWAQDPETGGGRIIGEACHFIDLARHLCGAPITQVRSSTLRGHGDTASIALEFGDGSIATVHYVSTGNARFPKERKGSALGVNAGLGNLGVSSM